MFSNTKYHLQRKTIRCSIHLFTPEYHCIYYYRDFMCNKCKENETITRVPLQPQRKRVKCKKSKQEVLTYAFLKKNNNNNNNINECLYTHFLFDIYIYFKVKMQRFNVLFSCGWIYVSLYFKRLNKNKNINRKITFQTCE